MSDNNHDSPPKRPDEIAVTEVSDEVLAELTQLFGPRDDTSVAIVDITTETLVEISDVTPSEFALEPEEVSNVISIVDETISEPLPRVTPVDPLLLGLSEEVAGDDDNSLVVIDDVDLDRVVIVDDDRPDSRFEERQRRHQRRERLRKVKWLKMAGAVVGLIVVVMAILASPIFAIRNIAIEGVVYTSDKTIASVTKTLKGASVFTVDTARAREILLADPWVSDVRVTTRFPSKAIVEVSEREPVVWYVGADGKARIVDARGHVIAVLKGFPTKYLQVIGQGPDLAAGAVADDAYRAAAQLVLALPDEVRPKVKSLELSTGGELSMILKGATIIRFGPPTDLQDKLVAVVVLLRRQDPATLSVIDVSTGEAAVQIR
ncbi:unannotated protein [freshwater metagenome]|uniref:Unannotated protein n=1 Tax=freshwater metagenome TaxID=449393 RepID=A0A6J6G3G5_9ZZZZ